MAAISWKSAVSGNWTTAADWSTGTVPGSGDDATIGVAGVYAVSLTTAITVDSITISDPGAIFAIAAPGSTETVTTTLTNSGTTRIDVVGGGGTTVKIGGALTNSGDLAIGNGGISSATKVSAASLANTGTLDLTGGTAAAALSLAGATTNGGSVVLTGRAILTGLAFTNNGTFAVDSDPGDTGGGGASLGGVTNHGQIDIGNSALATAVTVTAKGLLNSGLGTIDLAGGSGQAALDVTVAAPTALTGFVYLTGDALLEYASGSITRIGADSQLSLDGAEARVALAGNPGGNSALTGLATNDGEFDLADGASVTTTASFTNNEYTFVDSVYGPGGMAGGSRLTIGGTLTSNDYIDIGNAGIRTATSVTAAGLVNNGEIDLTGGAAQASLNILGAAPTTVIGSYYLEGNALLEFASGSITTVASGAELSLDGARARVALSSNTAASGALSGLASNSGTIDFADGASVSTSVGFTNDGYTYVDSDSYDTGGSSFTVGGTLTNNYVLAIGNADMLAATNVTAAGLVNNSEIDLTGGATTATGVTFDVTGAPSSPTLNGYFSLSGSAVLDYASGSITAIGSGATLSLDGAGSFVSIGTATGSNSALTKLASNAGDFELADRSVVTTTVGFDNTGYLALDADASGGSSFTVGGTLTNSGNLSIGNETITAAVTVKAEGLVNSGSIYLDGGTATLAELNVTGGAAPTSLIGQVFVGGDALLQFASGAITAIAGGASLSLDGALSRVALSATPGSNSALTKLASNAGYFELENGAALATTVAFANSGTLDVDAGTLDGGSSLTVGGTLTNSDYLEIGNSELAAATTVTAAGLVNTGSIYLTGGATTPATLKITAAAPASLSGYLSLVGDAVLDYASGSVTAIGSGATLSLDGAGARVAVGTATTSNSGLTKLASNAGDFYLSSGAAVATTVGFKNTGTLELDSSGSGGSSLKVGGTLANSGYLYIGNNGLGAATTVAATGLVNTGEISLTGGTATRATFTVSGAAPSTLSGYYYLDGYALLQFASGAITAIGSGATLSLDGALSRVALSATPGSNSALARLGGNAGALILENGSIVTTTVGFNNTGTLDVDSANYYYVASDLGGSTLTLGGPLSNIGTVSIGNVGITAAVSVNTKALANSGTIDLTGGTATRATLTVSGAAPSTLTGNYYLDGDALLQFSSGAITAIGSDAVLSLEGALSRVALTATPSSNSALTTLGRNAGTFDLADGSTVTTTTGFINVGIVNVDVDAGYLNAGGGSILTIGGSLTNTGTVAIGNVDITAAVVVKVQGLVNSGAIDLTGGATTPSELVVSGAAPSTLTGGYYLDGDALLQFASGAITAIGSGAGLSLVSALSRVALSAAPGSNSALTQLGSNAGSFALADGAVVGVVGNLTNTDAVNIDTQYTDTGGSSLTVGGTLINDYLIGIGNTGIVAATTVKAARLVNTGEIDITGGLAQAALIVNAPAPATVTATLDLAGNALLEYSSGAITAVEGGATLSLAGALSRIALSATPGSNSALTTLASNGGTLDLEAGAVITTTVAFANTGYINIDNGYEDSGGSSFTVGGTLTNNGGFINIGNTDISVASTVKATGLANSGTISLTGGAAQAVLAISGPAPSALAGQFFLSGNALLQYASGAITSIGSGAELSLTGNEAFVAVAATPGSNSALTTLGSNAGTLNLENGASLSTTTAFANRSLVYVDTGYLSGGSSLTLGGAFTNTGYMEIGNSGLFGTTTVKAASLANDSGGIISITGDSPGGTATLALTGASTDADSITVNGGGVLALGGTLTVTGALDLYGGTISGGTLAGAGTIAAEYGTSTLDGVTIATGATLDVAASYTLVVAGDTVNGAITGSSSSLVFAQPGTDTMTNISGFSTITLADGGANTLTLTSAAFISGMTTITVNDGNSNNTVNASSLPAADGIVVHAGIGTDTLTGGAGTNVFFAGGKTVMTGGSGTNEFVFSAPGTANTVTNFTASDEIVFSNSGFALGLTGATSTPQALPGTLFVADSTGTFTNSTQRFAYNTSTGKLYFDAAGDQNLASSPEQLVATIANHPSITSHLYFVS